MPNKPTPDHEPEKNADLKLQRLMESDRRYNHEAYLFVFEALNYTQHKFGKKAHVTGQELCEGIKDYAIERYGMLARVVLNDWGIQQTGDIGEIVFNLIDNELMLKTENDSRNDFKGLYSLKDVFEKDFKFNQPLKLD
jgi:uncharacterized repeat protein (TIGR04138 family)